MKIKLHKNKKKRRQRILCVSVFFFVWFCVTFFIFLLLLPCTASAQNVISPRLSVSPHTFDLGILPGETRTEIIKISNKSEVAIPISAKVVDFGAAGEGGEMTFDESLQDSSIASYKWFGIENPNFILEPGETEKVRFTISVPENAEPGGHYSVMLFEPKLPSFYFEAGKPRAIPVIGVLFLFSVQTFVLEPEIGQKLEIVEFSIPKEERIAILETSFSVIQRTYQRLSASISQVYAAEAPEIKITKRTPSSFVLRLKNNALYHIKPFGKVFVFNTFGKKVGETEVPQTTILPGKIRQFPITFSSEVPRYLKWLPGSIANFLAKNFFIGKYQAVLEIHEKTQIGTQKDTKDFRVVSCGEANNLCDLVFWAFPWKFWLSLIVIISLFIFFVIKYKKRIVLALRVLARK